MSEDLAGAHPPAKSPTLQFKKLSAGISIWRVHSDCFGPAEFNPTARRTLADGGGRFDCHDGSFAYLYAASDSVAAVAETLLRNPHPPAPYRIPYARIKGKRLSQITLTHDLKIVVLHGAGLSLAGLDSRLTSCGPGLAARGKSQTAPKAALFRRNLPAKPPNMPDIRSPSRVIAARNCTLSITEHFYHGLLGLANYAVTRKWATAIRSWDDTVAGLVWRPRHDNDRLAYVFFEDRCSKGVIQPLPDRSYPLDERGMGYWLANRAAMKHGAVLSLPSTS